MSNVRVAGFGVPAAPKRSYSGMDVDLTVCVTHDHALPSAFAP
jgi:hypothetical protein